MRLLNLGCGSVRPQENHWVNLDDLHSQLLPGTPERENLDKETNYVNHDISSGILPFGDNEFTGILCSHVIEHFDCMQGVQIMRECYRVLKTGGALVVSVPDASYFRQVIGRDNIDNSIELFGEPIHLPDGEVTFFDYALWMRQHKAILTEDSLWAYFKKANFNSIYRPTREWLMTEKKLSLSPQGEAIFGLINRTKFSLVMEGVK